MDIPVYLITGFLEAGKTKFLQETLEDRKFFEDKRDRTLVIQCEEGEEELDPSSFASQNIFIEEIDLPRRINPDKLKALRDKHRATRVVIEYNGMWLVKDLINALPDGWFIYQEMAFFDASSFEVYNANMRNLTVDKMSTADVVLFNRCEDDTDFDVLHKIVRGVTRRANIIYQKSNGQISYDNIEDPLPFDTSAPVVTVEDRDYALFYRDLTENLSDYNGKTVRFSGRINKSPALPKGSFVIGRPIMTCCVEDITFSGMFCENGADMVKTEEWVDLTAKINVKFSRVYGRKGPVLSLIDVKEAVPPLDTVATFY